MKLGPSSDPETFAEQQKALLSLVKTGALIRVDFMYGRLFSVSGMPLYATATLTSPIGAILDNSQPSEKPPMDSPEISINPSVSLKSNLQQYDEESADSSKNINADKSVCLYCKRAVDVPCRNCRDMHPDVNSNLVCNKALSDRGGGETGYVFTPPKVEHTFSPGDLVYRPEDYSSVYDIVHIDWARGMAWLHTHTGSDIDGFADVAVLRHIQK